VAAPLRGLRLEDVEDRDAAVLREVEWADVKCEPLLDRVLRVGKVTVDAEDARASWSSGASTRSGR